MIRMPKTLEIKITDRIPETKELLKHASERNVMEATLEAHRYLIGRVLVGTRSGKMYYVPATKTKYQASAPGEAPARRTGDLAANYGWEVKGTEGAVGNKIVDPPYPVYLEKGTKKMKPRPHLGRAFEEDKAAIIAKLSRRFD